MANLKVVVNEEAGNRMAAKHFDNHSTCRRAPLPYFIEMVGGRSETHSGSRQCSLPRWQLASSPPFPPRRTFPPRNCLRRSHLLHVGCSSSDIARGQRLLSTHHMVIFNTIISCFTTRFWNQRVSHRHIFAQSQAVSHHRLCSRTHHGFEH